MNWQTALTQGFKDPKQLLHFLGHAETETSLHANQLFQTRVPLSFAQKMQYGNLQCPLLRQVLPITDELEEKIGFISDPLQEKNFTATQGLLHKYKGRVLITLAGSCAINCRYCFRRHFAYKDNQINLSQWQNILKYLEEDPSINEIIFSGGDPLMVQTKRLTHYIQALESIKHIKTLRMHTRIPIVLPERIDNEFLSLMENTCLNKVMVIHTNHAKELCNKTAQAFSLLKQNNLTLLNQSVLLKGVNDDIQSLVSLSHKLFEQGILPYYIHLPDKVKATAHFDVSLESAQKLHKQMQSQLPGYLVPKLVREIPGEKNKTWV